MKTFTQFFLLLFCFLGSLLNLSGQEYQLKQPIEADEVTYLQQLFATIGESDQKYRSYVSNGTLDDQVIAKMDSVFEADGIEAALTYRKSLNLSLPKSVSDSLWGLQHQIDMQNHLTLRGVFDTYGFLPEEILGEVHYVQILLLMHPPKDWDIPSYLEAYSTLLKEEVKAGRMEPKTYASFYDNIKGKIMRENQLYGTNMIFDAKSGKVLPPIIDDLENSNAARKEIGLPPLASGEYRLSK